MGLRDVVLTGAGCRNTGGPRLPWASRSLERGLPHASLAMGVPVSSAPHVSRSALTAYVDGKLEGGAREQLESHLAVCDECRAQVMAASLTRDPLTQRRTSRTGCGLGALLAAAVVVALITFVRPPTAPRDDTDAERPGGSHGELQSLLPIDGATVDPTSLEFAWTFEEGAAYRLTVTDANGGAVWEANTRATSLRLPTDIVLPVGARFHWYVDALLPDGSTSASGPRSFTTAPP